jgi:alcohol dehydrogenase class IV
MKADLGIPATLGAMRTARPVTTADIPALVDVALADTCHKTNPRPCTRGDFESLFAAAI